MNLAATQHLLWRLITAPEGVAKALQENPGDASLLADSVAGVSSGAANGEATSHELTPTRRLEVYAGAYFARIHDALASDFSDLAAQLGEATFHDLVTSYLAIRPPHRPSLRDVGARLPEFLADGEGGEPFRARAPWAADLARLEWLQSDLFDAPDAVVATRRDFEKRAPEEWGGLTLKLIPAAGLLTLEWPVHTLCASWSGGTRRSDGANPISSKPSELLVWRASETVSYRPLEDPEAEALSLVAAGTTFGEVCQAAAVRIGDEEAPTHSAIWLARWLEDGLLTAVD